jgi:hypothetical protein
MFRVGTIDEVLHHLKLAQTSPLADTHKIALDGTAMNLLHCLLKQESRGITLNIKRLNKYLEQNVVGYIFQLIDCMNLLAVASFYL